jgi:hypothetical protein
LIEPIAIASYTAEELVIVKEEKISHSLHLKADRTVSILEAKRFAVKNSMVIPHSIDSGSDIEIEVIKVETPIKKKEIKPTVAERKQLLVDLSAQQLKKRRLEEDLRLKALIEEKRLEKEKRKLEKEIEKQLEEQESIKMTEETTVQPEATMDETEATIIESALSLEHNMSDNEFILEQNQELALPCDSESSDLEEEDFEPNREGTGAETYDIQHLLYPEDDLADDRSITTRHSSVFPEAIIEKELLSSQPSNLDQEFWDSMKHVDSSMPLSPEPTAKLDDALPFLSGTFGTLKEPEEEEEILLPASLVFGQPVAPQKSAFVEEEAEEEDDEFKGMGGPDVDETKVNLDIDDPNLVVADRQETVEERQAVAELHR